MEIIAPILSLIVLILLIISLWKIYAKAEQPGWAIFVPIYNLVVFLRIANKPAWWLVLLIIPVVNVFAGVIVIHNIAKSFGKGTGFTIGLLLLGIIFYPMLAFGNASYRKLQ